MFALAMFCYLAAVFAIVVATVTGETWPLPFGVFMGVIGTMCGIADALLGTDDPDR